MQIFPLPAGAYLAVAAQLVVFVDYGILDCYGSGSKSVLCPIL
jgi:hypothetical protein